MSDLVLGPSVWFCLQCYKHRHINSINKNIIIIIAIIIVIYCFTLPYPGYAKWFCCDSKGMVHSFRPKWLWPHITLSVSLSQSARTSQNRQKERKKTNFRIHSSWSERQTDGLFHPDYPNLLNIEIQAFFFPLLFYFFINLNYPRGWC